ncbi:MAG: hypothetical protein H6650_12855 [Ardenticatenales bacterium]|nr:hypothetical protein [Ardenticatenales bacterium]
MEPKKSTIAALLQDKPKRGRPPRRISRQNVYVALTGEEKQAMHDLADKLPPGLKRADIPDLAIGLLAVRLESIRRHVADREREMPEGITDMESLYLLWDLPLPAEDAERNWTSLRVSPQQAIELGRVQGTLHALFGANRSQVYTLGLALFRQAVQNELAHHSYNSVHDLQELIEAIFL